MEFREYCGDLSSTDEEDMELLSSSQPAAGRSGGLPAADLPFYALPRAKKTSAEIIHEQSDRLAAIQKARNALGDGRAVVRTVDTSRPFTPRDRQRTLFGSAQTSPKPGRPTSAFSMNSLSFDNSDSRPVSGIRLVPLNPRGFCKSSSPRQPETSDAITLPSLPDSLVSRPSNHHLPSLSTSWDRMNRRQFRAASLDKLPEEGEDSLAAVVSSRNAHSGPRERTRPTLDPGPRPPPSLPELSRPRGPVSVQRQIVDALRPEPGRPPPQPQPPQPHSHLELVLSQPEDAGDLCLSDLESSQRLSREFARAPPAGADAGAASASGAAASNAQADPSGSDDFGWSLFRKKRDMPVVGSGVRPTGKQPLPPSSDAGGGGERGSRLHPDSAPLRRAVVAGRRGRSSSPRSDQSQIEYSESRPGSGVSGAGDEPPSSEHQIIALLARLADMADNGATNEAVLVTVVDLYQLLSETGHLGRSSPHRIATLKTIFRFVERQDSPRLLVHISRTILALQVSGKNLVNVCKLVFKVAQDDKNDPLFLEANILEHLLETVGRSSPLDDGEACVYSYGALKFLTMNAALVTRLMNLGILDLVVLHMKLITTKKLESKSVSEQTGHALYQLTGVLRNLANVETTLPRLVPAGATTQVCTVLALFTADMDVIANVARILSIISTHDACCDQLVTADLSFRACVQALNKYPGAAAIVVRLGYALGNLMARSEQARVKFFAEPKALDTLLRLLEHYSRYTGSGSGKQNVADTEPGPRAGLAAAAASGARADPKSDPGALTGTPEDVMVKLVRVVANMVINQEVGSEVSNSPACLRVLLTLLRTHSVEDHEELVLSSLSMLNNLTFYATEDSVVFERQQEVTHCLCAMLRHDHTECQIEVLRVFGNLTRWPAVREALGERQVVSCLSTLLDSENRELVYTTVGVLINLMTDPGKRLTFTGCDGIDKLILVLEDFGYSDWQLAALVCKVLWNLAADTDDVGSVLSEQQADQLAVVLDEYLDDEVLFPETGLTAEEQQIAGMLRPLWEEFADVASSLLEKLDDSLENVLAGSGGGAAENTKTA